MLIVDRARKHARDIAFAKNYYVSNIFEDANFEYLAVYVR